MQTLLFVDAVVGGQCRWVGGGCSYVDDRQIESKIVAVCF